MKKEKEKENTGKNEQAKDELNKLVEALNEKNSIIEKRENEIEDLKIEIIKLKEQFRKEQNTIEKQAEQKVNNEKKKLMREFLEIFDNFERALSSVEKDDPSVTKQGIQLIHSQIDKFLKQQGLKEIELEGKQFNPDLCEIGEIIKTNKEKPNTILKVLRKGYYLKDELLRTAIVAVSVPEEDKKQNSNEGGNEK